LNREAAYYEAETGEKLTYRTRSKGLYKYQGRDDVFCSFTKIPKLGINPKSEWMLTPNGIYCYPVDYLLTRVKDEFFSTFAGTSPYLYVFEVSDLSNILIFKKSNSSLASQFKSDSSVIFPWEDRLKELSVVQKMGEKRYLKFKNGLQSRGGVRTDQGFVWEMTRLLSRGNIHRWTGLLREMGVTGARDYGTGTIHPSLETQAVFFDFSLLRVLDVINNKEPERRHLFVHEEQLSKWSQDIRRYAPQIVSSLKKRINDLGTRFKIPYHAKSIIAYLNWLNQNQDKILDIWNEKIKMSILRVMENDSSLVDMDQKTLRKIRELLREK
jgi:hypothetical protein